MNQSKLYFFWKIGKSIYENQTNYPNIIQKYSKYYSYRYGNSSMFSRRNMYFMKKFYINFPIFYEKLNYITWEQYQLLLLLPNIKERYFYFFLSLLFHCDYQETYSLIMNDYYSRI